MNKYYGVPSTSSEDFLAHFGIKGMKWGIRKAIDKQRAIDSKHHSNDYHAARKKLLRAYGVSAAAGIGAGLATMNPLVGLATDAGVSEAYRFAKRKQLAKTSIARKDFTKSAKSGTKISRKDSNALNDYRNAQYGRSLGYFGGTKSVIDSLNFKKNRPKDYQRARKAIKNMSFKERLKYSYGR